MSGSYHSITIVGNVTRDPEMKYTPEGKAITNFTLAENTVRRGQECTIWWSISCFGKTAENANQYIGQGDMVLVDGRMAFDAATGGPKVYTRRSGEAGSSFEVEANEVRFLVKKRQDQQPPARQQQAQQAQRPAQPARPAQPQQPQRPAQPQLPPQYQDDSVDLPPSGYDWLGE